MKELFALVRQIADGGLVDMQCSTCKYKPLGDGKGWCYMFRNRPAGHCGQHEVDVPVKGVK